MSRVSNGGRPRSVGTTTTTTTTSTATAIWQRQQSCHKSYNVNVVASQRSFVIGWRHTVDPKPLPHSQMLGCEAEETLAVNSGSSPVCLSVISDARGAQQNARRVVDCGKQTRPTIVSVCLAGGALFLALQSWQSVVRMWKKQCNKTTKIGTCALAAPQPQQQRSCDGIYPK